MALTSTTVETVEEALKNEGHLCLCPQGEPSCLSCPHSKPTAWSCYILVVEVLADSINGWILMLGGNALVDF